MALINEAAAESNISPPEYGNSRDTWYKISSLIGQRNSTRANHKQWRQQMLRCYVFIHTYRYSTTITNAIRSKVYLKPNRN
jgi:hypothetical protein